MNVLFINRKQIYAALWAMIILTVLVGVRLHWDRTVRKIFGVKNGVYLEGYNVEGMLPEEVSNLVKKMAVKVNREPQNAGYFSETGEIIPSKPGKMVMIADTVNKVCMAKPGSRLNLVVAEVPAKISEDFFKPVYQGKPESQKVAFAINVAWGEEFLGEMLKTLEEEKVKATFFFVGSWVKAFPELVKEIAAAGHEIANHGLYHGHPQQMRRDELRRLILENAALLRSVTGKEPSNLFAPPYGEINAEIVGTAGELGYRTVMWSVDTVDWKNPGPDLLLQRVMGKIQPGGIILMHPTVSTAKALPRLIKALREKGLTPGTVSSVLE
mgnify:CR=1 FL=1